MPPVHSSQASPALLKGPPAAWSPRSQDQPLIYPPPMGLLLPVFPPQPEFGVPVLTHRTKPLRPAPCPPITGPGSATRPEDLLHCFLSDPLIPEPPRAQQLLKPFNANTLQGDASSFTGKGTERLTTDSLTPAGGGVSRVRRLATPGLSPPGSSPLRRIFPGRVLKWVAMPSSRGSSQPGGQTHLSCIAGGFFSLTELPGKPCDVCSPSPNIQPTDSNLPHSWSQQSPSFSSWEPAYDQLLSSAPVPPLGLAPSSPHSLSLLPRGFGDLTSHTED